MPKFTIALPQLDAAIEKARESHVTNMTEKAGFVLFGLSLAVSDEVLSREEADGFEERIRRLVHKAGITSAQSLYDLNDEVSALIDRNAALKEASKVDRNPMATNRFN
jgi:predicted ATP-grasp superfamily ATP-dependent carboligase